MIMAKKIARTRSENRPIAERERARPATAPPTMPSSDRGPRRPQPVQRDGRRRSRRCRRTWCARTTRCRYSRAAGRSSRRARRRCRSCAATLSARGAGKQERRQRERRSDDASSSGVSTPAARRIARTSDRCASSPHRCHRIEAARAPQQDRDHQQDVRDQRQLRREEAGVVRRPAPTRIAPMKQPPTEPRPPMMMTMKTRTVMSPPMRGVHLLAIERPHHAAEAGQRRAGHEHADEQPADAIAQRLDHLAVLDAGADQQGRSWCGSAPAACAANTDEADDDREQRGTSRSRRRRR